MCDDEHRTKMEKGVSVDDRKRKGGRVKPEEKDVHVEEDVSTTRTKEKRGQQPGEE